MANNPQPMQSLTTTLVLNDAAKALALYAKAFGAKEVYRMEMPGTRKIMHSCITIGNSKLFICDTDPNMCATPSIANFYLMMPDVDAALKQAKSAGLEEMFPAQDMFWGDRTGVVKDAFGIRWTLATHVRDVSEQEMAEGAKKFASQKAA